MKKIDVKGQQVPAVAMGCMRLQGAKDPVSMIETAYKSGITFYDHADIYGRGECEKIFGSALKKSSIKREDIYIQSKCSIVPGKRFDFSKEYILQSVDGILERLQTDYLDCLLLHRPDVLMDPLEVSAAFDELKASGKVRHFGVSNMGVYQIKLLKKYLNVPIEYNQLQFSIMHCGMLTGGLHINMDTQYNTDGIYEYCRLHDIRIQAWSPFQYGFFEGVFIDNEKFPELNEQLDVLAKKYSTTKTGIAVVWILNTPNTQVISGSMNEDRIQAIAKASDITLSKQEWYDVYLAAGNDLP